MIFRKPNIIMNSARDICTNIIYEVLTHSSMKTVEKCRLLSNECNKFTYKTTFTKLHNQRTNIVFGFFVQNMIRNEYHVSFVLIDTPKPYPEMSLDFLSWLCGAVIWLKELENEAIGWSCHKRSPFVDEKSSHEWLALLA